MSNRKKCVQKELNKLVNRIRDKCRKKWSVTDFQNVFITDQEDIVWSLTTNQFLTLVTFFYLVLHAFTNM